MTINTTDSENFYRLKELLRLKGFRHVEPNVWMFDDFPKHPNRYIVVNALEEDLIEVNFNEEEFVYAKPLAICIALHQFYKLW